MKPINHIPSPSSPTFTLLPISNPSPLYLFYSPVTFFFLIKENRRKRSIDAGTRPRSIPTWLGWAGSGRQDEHGSTKCIGGATLLLVVVATFYIIPICEY
jgi:hypothetical protein